MQSCDNSSSRKAFTLIEVLAVVVLLGLLAVFIVPQILNRITPAKRSIAVAQIANLQQFISAFEQDTGRFPEQSEGLGALVEQPAGLASWAGPYCGESQLIDPWKNPYVYNRPGQHGRPYDIICYGADGQQGGEDADADIISE
ncbi:MAG: type II secretion system major pseudopilin GspG [Sedimentisphaerales bacterium]|nr:type II secretion system major pseudopilin GspG [Sedimentisphaerales bacterium]